MKRLTVRLMHIASNVRSQAHHEVVWDPGQLKKAVTPGDVIMTCRKSGKKHFMAFGGPLSGSCSDQPVPSPPWVGLCAANRTF